MGFFDRFGAGGGKLEVHPAALRVAPGQVLEGSVSFTAGSRAQQITNVKLSLNQTVHYEEKTQQGPQHRTRSQLVAPEVVVTGAFTSQPGNRYDFPFRIQLPPQLTPSAPKLCQYRLSTSADIDNEIDPGAGVDIEVVGGMQAQGAMPGAPMMGAPMMGAPMMGAPMMPGMQPAMPPMAAPLGIGSPVLAQWQDGQLHPGRVVQMQNGYVAVDWDNPQLGATAWVGQHQVQPSPMAMGGPMMGAPPSMPMMGALAPGALVYGQTPDGQWHPGRIVQSQNGYHAVDWDEPKLGATVWLSPAQVSPR